MIHSVRFKAVLDTNVLHPLTVRDLLLWFAYYDLYTPKWSSHIFDEWKSVIIRTGQSQEEAEKRVQKANEAFPFALVDNYENLIESLDLPDANDRHVLAAAIRTNANVIVTNNLKDFPGEYLKSYGLSTKSADDFLTDIIDLNPHKAIEAFNEMVLNRRNPDLSAFEILDMLRKSDLIDTANYLHSQI